MELKLAKKGEPLPVDHKEVSRAVEAFVKDSHAENETFDKNGFIGLTAQAIAAATFLNKGGDFWYVEENGRLLAYCLAEFGRGADGRFVYFCNQTWLAPDVRHTGAFKSWFETIRTYAKQHLAKRIVLVSSRNPDAYCRVLGLRDRKFTTLIEEDI